MQSIVWLFLALFLPSLLFAKLCTNCHSVASFDKINHDFSCENCHLLKKDRKKPFSHESIIAYPGSNENMSELCSSCHEAQIAKYKASNHYSYKNEISSIYKSFGLNKSPSIEELKLEKVDLQTKEGLISDLLQRKCLKCHSAGSSVAGRGCFSCHIVYEGGVYKGQDAHSFKGPHSKSHTLSKSALCTNCHFGYYTGASFAGAIPSDDLKDFLTPLDKKGRFPTTKQGLSFHFLEPDVHFKAGFACVNCHLMGEKASCASCHKMGKNHQKNHKRLSCFSCHASWQPSFYQLSLLLDFSKDYEKYFAFKNTPFMQKKLKILAKRGLLPFSYDLLGVKKPGIWYQSFELIRFENVILGEKAGKIELFRPFFQYKLGVKDEKGFIKSWLKASSFKVAKPHTIGKSKACENCHVRVESFGGEGRLFRQYFLSKESLKKLDSLKYKSQRARQIKGL